MRKNQYILVNNIYRHSVIKEIRMLELYINTLLVPDLWQDTDIGSIYNTNQI